MEEDPQASSNPPDISGPWQILISNQREKLKLVHERYFPKDPHKIAFEFKAKKYIGNINFDEATKEFRIEVCFSCAYFFPMAKLATSYISNRQQKLEIPTTLSLGSYILRAPKSNGSMNQLTLSCFQHTKIFLFVSTHLSGLGQSPRKEIVTIGDH